MTHRSRNKTTHIAMLSGGRDSTAMVFYMLDAGYVLDYIIFADTGHEFPEMYEYIDRVDERLKKDYDHRITRISHKRGETFEDWCYGYITSGPRKGMVRGVPMVTQPYQKTRGFYVVWKNHKKLWRYMQRVEDKLTRMGDGVINPQWNIRYTMEELDSAFSSGDILFDVEAPKSCECEL